MSSGEAEYYSLVEGVVRGKGVRQLGKELGVEDCAGPLRVGTDASAAKSLASRRGAGKARHIEVRWYWLQEEVRTGRVILKKVSGEWNPADLMTKYLNSKTIGLRLGALGLEAQWVRDEGESGEVGRCEVGKVQVEVKGMGKKR